MIAVGIVGFLVLGLAALVELREWRRGRVYDPRTRPSSKGW